MSTSFSPSSSLDMLTPTSPNTRWASDSLSDDEDEIVWSLSSSAMLSSSSPPPPPHTSSSPLSEAADYVLVPRMNSTPIPAGTVTAAGDATTLSDDAIAEGMATLSLSNGAAHLPSTTSVPTTTKKKSKKKSCRAGENGVPVDVSMPPGGVDSHPLPPASAALTPTTKRKKAAKKAAARTSSSSPSPSSSDPSASSPTSSTSSSSSRSSRRPGGRAPGRAKSETESAAAGAAESKRCEETYETNYILIIGFFFLLFFYCAVTTPKKLKKKRSKKSASGSSSHASSAAEHVANDDVNAAKGEEEPSSKTISTGYHEAHKFMSSYVPLTLLSLPSNKKKHALTELLIRAITIIIMIRLTSHVSFYVPTPPFFFIPRIFHFVQVLSTSTTTRQ
jgi:hypothetical protein